MWVITSKSNLTSLQAYSIIKGTRSSNNRRLILGAAAASSGSYYGSN